MNIRNYLEAKYGVGRVSTMLYCEALAFGLVGKMKNGWIKKYGDVEITSDMADRLRKSLEKSKKQSAQAGLKVLNDAYLELKSIPDANSRDFLQSKAWKRLRLMALKQHGMSCQICGASPKTGAVLNVDHVLPRKLFPSHALRLDNLQVLCADCNEGKGNWDMTDAR